MRTEFTKQADEWAVSGWDDIDCDEVNLGALIKLDDGYWRFMPANMWITCSQLIDISKQVAELNTSGA